MEIKIDPTIEQEQLKDLYNSIVANIDDIEKLELNTTNEIETSSLISMLVSFKKSYKDKAVVNLENNTFINALGKIVIKE